MRPLFFVKMLFFQGIQSLLIKEKRNEKRRGVGRGERKKDKGPLQCVCLYPSSFSLSAHTSTCEYLANATREREIVCV